MNDEISVFGELSSAPPVPSFMVTVSRIVRVVLEVVGFEYSESAVSVLWCLRDPGDVEFHS